MDAGMINPFIQGTQSVFSTLFGESPALGKLYVKPKPYSPKQVTVAITFKGGLSGKVIYNMRESDACFIASQMMMGAPVPKLDDMSSSAVSEMANMVSGNVATIFTGKGVVLDITPPLFRINAAAKDFPESETQDKILCVPLNFKGEHTIELDIMIA